MINPLISPLARTDSVLSVRLVLLGFSLFLPILLTLRLHLVHLLLFLASSLSLSLSLALSFPLLSWALLYSFNLLVHSLLFCFVGLLCICLVIVCSFCL